MVTKEQVDQVRSMSDEEIATMLGALSRVGFELRKWLEDDANGDSTFGWTPDDIAALLRERDEAVKVACEQTLGTLERLAREDEARRDAYWKEHHIPGYMSTHRAAALRDAIATLSKEGSQ